VRRRGRARLATRPASGAGTPSATSSATRASKASRSSATSTSGSAAATSAAPDPNRPASGPISSGRGRLRSSQRVARSTRRRAFEQHRDLRAGVDLEVERLDLGPDAAHAEDVAGDGVRRARCPRASRRLLAQPEDERDAGAVDDAVRDARGDDLAPQAMVRQPSPKRSGSGAGK
jgi:hypothetical protein